MEAASVPAENGGGQAEQAQAPAVDLSSVLSRVDEIGQSVGQLGERFDSFQPQAPPEQEQGSEYDDTEFDFGPGFDPEDPQQAQQWLDSLVDKRAKTVAEQQMQAAVEPLMQQLDEITTEREAQTFLARYPEFADEQRAEAFMDHASQVVQSLGLPDEVAGKLVSSSTFLGLVAEGARKQEAARNEVAPQEQQRTEHQLEPAGGANLGGGEQDPALSIVKARGGNSFWGT